ncbi:MAG: hypothetical protein ACLRM9_09895 [Collinsella aerofaciens]
MATDDQGKHTRRVKVTVVTQNDNEAVVGKTQVKRDDQGNEISPTCRLPSCAMSTLVMDARRTQRLKAAGTDSGSMSTTRALMRPLSTSACRVESRRVATTSCNVSLVEPGEFVAITGPSGSGDQRS